MNCAHLIKSGDVCIRLMELKVQGQMEHAMNGCLFNAFLASPDLLGANFSSIYLWLSLTQCAFCFASLVSIMQFMRANVLGKTVTISVHIWVHSCKHQRYS
ncbi:hypothetical protein ABZP36_022488 [Zizania latifolia]